MKKSPRIPIARRLRRDDTCGERLLWAHIRDRKINGRKWRRQRPIGPYFVDFYCDEVGLVIEIDGPLHEYRKEKDKERQLYLESLGLTVVRFPDSEVTRRLDIVLEKISSLTQ